VQEIFRDSPVTVVAVGFSPAEGLAALADALGWQGPFLSDEQRTLYLRLGLPRASVLQAYSPGTVLRYAHAMARGHRLTRAVEDTRQLGGDAVLVDGEARVVWRPRTPDDRVDPALVRSTSERLRRPTG